MISVIDYGTGNVTALANILRQLKIPFKITNDLEIISKSDKYILPGVGSFDSSKKNLKNLDIYDLLREEELQGLIDNLRSCKMPYTCPHGRPTIIEMSYSELEKKFGRIQ